jgi:hypothetical protein
MQGTRSVAVNKVSDAPRCHSPMPRRSKRQAIPAAFPFALAAKRRPRTSVRRAGAILQTACKPNSVEDGHSSRRCIAAALQRPTRRFPLHARQRRSWITHVRAPGRHAWQRIGSRRQSLPIWSCSVWGLPCLRRYRRSGALLPHLFTLTFGILRGRRRYLLCGTSRLAALTPRSRTLSGTLPCGVRTFLSRTLLPGSGRPARLQLSS